MSGKCWNCSSPTTLFAERDVEWDWDGIVSKTLQEHFCRSPLCLAQQLLYFKYRNEDNNKRTRDFISEKDAQIKALTEENNSLKFQLQTVNHEESESLKRQLETVKSDARLEFYQEVRQVLDDINPASAKKIKLVDV